MMATLKNNLNLVVKKIIVKWIIIILRFNV
jgi:hypothetical protein